jgi:hypothetical protein
MDPYVEADRPDIALSLLVDAADHLQPLLPSDLVARVTHDAFGAAWYGDGPPVRWIEIKEHAAGRLVTTVHFLSPGIKTPGAASEHHKRRRRDHAAQGVNQVEIDLSRQGHRIFVWPEEAIPRLPSATYYALIWVCGKRKRVEVYAMRLREPLAAIGIPLRERELSIPLALQPLVDEAYRKGRYADTMDYREPCAPPLEGEDAAWADDLLKSAGKR